MASYFSAGMFSTSKCPLEITRNGNDLWFRDKESLSSSFNVTMTAEDRARIRELLDEMDAEDATKASVA